MDNINELRKKYYESIKLLQDENDILEALPQPGYGNFFSIINGLIQCLDEELVELQQELNETLSSNDEMKEYIEDEIRTLLFKKEVCIRLLEKGLEDKTIEEESEKVSKKNIIFATTDSGNLCIENDLKTIPEEYYDTAFDLLQRLQSGVKERNSEKAKLLSSNDRKVAHIHEVKEFKVRLYYKNISSDTVYVMMIRMKKDNYSALDRKDVVNRSEQRNKQYEELKIKIKDPDEKARLVSENKKVMTDLCDYLNNNRRGR